MGPERGDLFPADEHTDLIPRVVWATRLIIAIALVVAGVAFAAAVVLPAIAPPGPPVVAASTRTALELEAKGVASAIEAAARAAEVRAQRIAQATMVRAAVMTDKATVADMAKSDFEYTPIKDERLIQGETLELFQLRGGQVISLLRIPATAPPIQPLHGHDMRIDPVPAGVDVAVGCPVEQYKDGPGYPAGVSGAIALSIPIDLAFVRQQLTSDARDATLVGLAAPVVLAGHPSASEAGPVLRLPIQLGPDRHLAAMALEVHPKARRGQPGWVGPVRYACAGLALVMLVVAALVWARRR